MADEFVTDITKFSKETQDVLAKNGQGMSAEEYLKSRGGVNPITHKYGDSYNPNVDLNDAEYLAAVRGGGSAINSATAKKKRDYIAANPDSREAIDYEGRNEAKMNAVKKRLAEQAARNSANNLSTSGSVVEVKQSNPTPPTPPPPLHPDPPPPPVKTAPIDTVLFNDDSMSIEIMTDLIFEDIGGHELINIARNDTINGQEISYTPIKNLGLIQQKYNPNNILGLQATSEKYFANFAIKFEEKVPKEGNGLNGANVYFDETTGDLIIEGVNINKDELFEVEVSLNGTIYEANFGATTS